VGQKLRPKPGRVWKVQLPFLEVALPAPPAASAFLGFLGGFLYWVLTFVFVFWEAPICLSPSLRVF
jgi:hypothetical protein